MPFLRFTRDKRGYETTALMHSSGERGRAQPRILYWFRGPVTVKVGRQPIDEQAIRLIEEHHPDLTFDWAKILESRAVAQAEGAFAERTFRDRSREPRPPASGRNEPAAGEAPGDRTGTADAEKRTPWRRSRRRGQPSRDAGAVSDAETPAARATEAAETPHATAAEEHFSPEDLTRLRGRHAALLARIDRASTDPAAAEPLRQAAEALNPDTWVTREDVERALERYEAAYRDLLDALGPRNSPGATSTGG